MVSATTPGEISVCRGMFAECPPHLQTHFVCDPVSALIEQPAVSSALSTRRRFMGFGIQRY
jgi:hypothetical protein